MAAIVSQASFGRPSCRSPVLKTIHPQQAKHAEPAGEVTHNNRGIMQAAGADAQYRQVDGQRQQGEGGQALPLRANRKKCDEQDQQAQYAGDQAVQWCRPGQRLVTFPDQLLISIFSRYRFCNSGWFTDAAVTSRPVGTTDSRVRQAKVGAE